MSDFGVYDDEMLNNRFSDQEVERLLSGGMPEDEDLAGLAPILEKLHGGQRSLAEEGIARFAAQAAEIARSTRPTAVPVRTTTRSRRSVLALRQKMATGLAAALLLSGMTGVAFASNHAAPGDALYGLDRALEAVGIGDGGAAERISEAQALFNQGQIAEAVGHAAEAVELTEVEGESEIEANIEAITSEEASEALLTAAEKLQTNTEGSEEAIAVRTNVALLLEYMATTEDTGDVFGQGVAALARQISGESNEAADNGADNADNAAVGADNADDAADESEDAPPEDVPSGPPDSVPPSDTTGRP